MKQILLTRVAPLPLLIFMLVTCSVAVFLPLLAARFILTVWEEGVTLT